MVAVAIWESMDRVEDWVKGMQSPSDAEMVDPEGGKVDEIGTEVAVHPETVTSKRTA